MAVVLTILKILGIILLCIIGLLLLILLMVLFIPIRYRVNGSYTAENISASVKVRWFILRILGNYNKGDPISLKAKVAWFTVYSREIGGTETPEIPEEGGEMLPPPGEQPTESPSDTQKPPGHLVGNESASHHPAENTEPPADRKEEGPKEKQAEKPSKPSEEKPKEKKPKEKPPKPDLPAEGVVEDPQESPFDKMEALMDKIETKRSHIEQFLERDATQQTIQRGKKLLIRIFKHLKPTKGHIDLHIGLGSAADTGMILGYAARFYPLFGKWLFITPDFYEKVIEAAGDVKGRIRIGTLAIPALVFYLRKDTRRTIKLAKKI